MEKQHYTKLYLRPDSVSQNHPRQGKYSRKDNTSEIGNSEARETLLLKKKAGIPKGGITRPINIYLI